MLKDEIYNYETKYKQGFIREEVEELIKKYSTISREKFESALTGITCMMIDGNIIFYHTDIYNALRCGLENRDLTIYEWD